MNLQELTQFSEELIAEHMQAAINAKSVVSASLHTEWAYGAKSLWYRLAKKAVTEESSQSTWLELVQNLEKTEERFNKLIDSNRVPLLNNDGD